MANVPSGIIIAWDGTNAGIPANWSRVTSLDANHPRGSALNTDPGGTGGATTHTHLSDAHTHTFASHVHTTVSSSSPDQVSVTGAGANVSLCSVSHTHTSGSSNNSQADTGTTTATWNTASTDPAFYGVIWIQSNGSPTGFPANSTIFFNNQTLPTNWAQLSGAKGKFLKGATAAGDGGGTGGAATHSHTGVSHSHTTQGHDHGAAVISSSSGGSSIPSGTANQQYAIAPHTHLTAWSANVIASDATTSATGGTSNGEPPYAMLIAIKNGAGVASWPVGAIALWTGTLATIPSGWTLCDGRYPWIPDLRTFFVKCANALTDLGLTGGAQGHGHANPATHSHTSGHGHTVIFANADSQGLREDNTTGATSAALPTHTHNATATSASVTSDAQTQDITVTLDTRPPYVDVAFVMFTGTMTATVTVPADSSTVTNQSPTFTWSTDLGRVQLSAHLIVYASDGTTIVYDAGVVTAATQSATVPIGYLLTGTTYKVAVTVVDTTGTSATSAQNSFTTAFASPPATITGLAVGKIGGT